MCLLKGTGYFPVQLNRDTEPSLPWMSSQHIECISKLLLGVRSTIFFFPFYIKYVSTFKFSWYFLPSQNKVINSLCSRHPLYQVFLLSDLLRLIYVWHDMMICYGKFQIQTTNPRTPIINSRNNNISFPIPIDTLFELNQSNFAHGIEKEKKKITLWVILTSTHLLD